MDLWRAVYQLTRLYVWSLTLVGLFTVGLLVVPRGIPDPQLAGVWFAVGGFGSLLLVTVLIVVLFRGP
jgi:hypothetical protein